MDPMGIDKAVSAINSATLPEVDKMGQAWIDRLIDGLHSILDRFEINIAVHPRKQ
jgi:hypothetical protein